MSDAPTTTTEAPGTASPPPEVAAGQPAPGADPGTAGSGLVAAAAAKAAAAAAAIPPARVASVAGEVLQPTDYNDMLTGRPSDGIGGPVAPAMPPPMMDLSQTPAAALDPGTAQVRARVMIATLQSWLAANPHPLQGQEAFVSNFFKELEARRLAAIVAGELGRDVPLDEVDKAATGPSAEIYEMADMAAQAEALVDGYTVIVVAAGIVVPDNLIEIGDGLKAKAQEIMAKIPPPPPTPEPAPPATGTDTVTGGTGNDTVSGGQTQPAA